MTYHDFKWTSVYQVLKDQPELFALKRSEKLRRFVYGYVGIALDSSEEAEEADPDKGFGSEPFNIHEIDADTFGQMITECMGFMLRVEALVEIVQRGNLTDKAEDALEKLEDFERMGSDFWHTRAGSGVGFWEADRWPLYGAALDTIVTDHYPPQMLYRGDDGLIYQSEA